MRYIDESFQSTVPFSPNQSDNQTTNYALRGSSLNKLVLSRDSLFKPVKHPILNDIDINVAKGKIYGLLGPSGCGKTTLLKCLIGMDDFTSGNLQLDNQIRSDYKQNHINLKKLGFMPQDSCLYTDLTINETFQYFGKLYCMTAEQIKEKREFFRSLLNLPTEKRRVGSLSGGQSRRISFAISLINDPNILMLDEPTVGVDPILRKRIWSYLEELTTKKMTTIIITTHYIEEAKKANCLGFMRQGHIIEENSPEFLIQKYQKTDLEDIFYTISLEINIECLESHKNIIIHPKQSEDISKVKISDRLTKSLASKIDISFDRLTANLYKDTTKCRRNLKLLIVQFLIPIVQITFFYLCIGQKPQNLPFGIVNKDTTFKLFGDDYNLGNEIVGELQDRTLIKKNYQSYNDAYQELKFGNLWGIMSIDANFSREVLETVVQKTLPDRFTSHMKILLDATNFQVSYTVKEEVLIAIKSVLLRHSSVYKEYKDSDYPIIFEKPIYGDDIQSFTNFMAPGIALSVIFFLSVASTASNYVLERQLGLVERSYLAGARTIELLLSQLIIYSLIMLIQIAIVIVLLFVLLGLPLVGSMPLLVALLSSQGFCGLCYGLCLAAITHDQETVMQLTLASFYPIVLMSGIIWPIEAQPVWLAKYLSKLLPLTYATEAFRDIVQKGWGLSNNFVLRGFASTYIWTLLFSASFLLMFSHKRNKMRS